MPPRCFYAAKLGICGVFLCEKSENQHFAPLPPKELKDERSKSNVLYNGNCRNKPRKMCSEKNGRLRGALIAKWAVMSGKKTKTRVFEAKYTASLFKIIVHWPIFVAFFAHFFGGNANCSYFCRCKPADISSRSGSYCAGKRIEKQHTKRKWEKYSSSAREAWLPLPQ